MKYGKIVGVVLILILAIVGILYFYSKLNLQPAQPKFSSDDFESTTSNSTPIIASASSTYSYKDYDNVPTEWTIRFDPSGEFQWVNDISHSSAKSIRMSNAGGITADRRINATGLQGKTKILQIWAKSNGLNDGFGFVEVRSRTGDKKTLLLKRSGKIIGSNDWTAIKLKIAIPKDAEYIFIKLGLFNKLENPDLYESMPVLFDNRDKLNEELPSESIWFDDLRLLNK